MKKPISKNSIPSFTINDIEQMATNSSFERGEDYFISGDVQDVTKSGNRFDAVVYGSRKYKVYLIDDADKLHLDCNCPYGFGGICKHLVAFMLKIIAGDYQEITQETIPTLSENDFKSLYAKIESKKKLLFLEQLLDRDNNLKQQFIAFSKDKTEKLDTIIGEKLEDIKFTINAKLSNLDFDDLEYNHNNYDNDGSYRDYWEIDFDAAFDEIKNVFEPYNNSILKYIKKGNLLDATRILLGLYEGTQNLPELDNENCVFDGQYNENVQTIVDEYIRDISYAIDTIVKSDKAILEVITLIFERISFYKNQKRDKENEINYNIKEFELLLKSLTINTEIAVFLHKKIQENKLESLASAFILLTIANVSENEKLWIKIAETYANLDAKITKQLLEKYDTTNTISDFNRIAKMAFKNWANEFDKYLIDHLDKEQQETLFVKALNNYVSDKTNIKHYRILKTYLTKEETIVFVDKFKDTYNSVFYVQLLEIEKRFEEILTCVNKNKDSYEIEKLINPILNI
ncbi:MAG: hypothetical protein L3J08_00115 [Flavobacteriaceae bacterium]|nr:hypothetical protein [Flavobacteriaceae bacterium]